MEQELKLFENANLRRVEGDLGVEVEVESSDGLLPRSPNDKVWRSVVEGSLRGASREFILTKPLDLTNSLKAIKTLLGTLEQYNIVQDSLRTSVHVHVNMLDCTCLEIWNTIISMWLVEDLISEFCGDHRKGNLFCLRISDAEGILRQAESNINLNRGFTGFYQEDFKYSGLNLCNLMNLGTLENRMMRGVLDYDILEMWIVNMLTMKNKAINNFKYPTDIVDTYLDKGDSYVLDSILSKNMSMFVKSTPDWNKKLDRSMKLLYNIIYCCDWEKYGKHVWRKKKLTVGQCLSQANIG